MNKVKLLNLIAISRKAMAQEVLLSRKGNV
jgi:hypothetical protein